MPIAGRCTHILPLDTSLTDHAARTGKCGMPVVPACPHPNSRSQ